MLAYKLLPQRADGSLGPLFIDRQRRIPLYRWLEAEDKPTKGFAHRPGWHCTMYPTAPHLKLVPKGRPRRVWCRVELGGHIRTYPQPERHGGLWLLAERLRVVHVLPPCAPVPAETQ